MSGRRAAARDQIRVLRGDDRARIIDLTQYEPSASPAVAAGPGRAGVQRHYARVGFALVLIDVGCLTVALFAAHWIKFEMAPDRRYLLGMVLAGALWILVFHAQALYAPQHLTGLEEFRRTLSAVGIGIVLVILLSFWSRTYLSRWWVVLTLVIALVLELTARRIVRRREQRLHASEDLVVRTLIVGGKDVAASFEDLDLRGSGFIPIGFLDMSSPEPDSDDLSTFELVEHLRTVLRHHQPDCVLVTSPSLGTKAMVAVMRAARQEAVLVRIYTHLSGIWASRLTAQRVGRDGVALSIKPASLSRLQRITKRGMDMVLAGLGLVLTSPVLLVSAIAIKATSPGPLFFKQDRVTEGTRTFEMLKLRTMDHDAEQAIRREADTTVPFFKVKGGDPRSTRVGRFLRKWSIDELPQLLNVMRGDMSLVGPRPLPAEQVAAHVELLGPRHEVRAGITGWWQIHGRANVDADEAIRMDQFYIENWTPALDAFILLQTVGILFTRRGAY